MELQKAKAISEQIIQTLKPYCIHIQVAGSILRGRPDVKDIEIVLTRKNALLYEFKTAMDKWVPFKGQSIGRYTQRKIPCERYISTLSTCDHVVADFFMPLPEDYYRILAIRTGPAEFSQKVIAAGWVKKGWVGTEHGLRRADQCIKRGDKWMIDRDAVAPDTNGIQHFTLPPVWHSEQEFFKWIGVRYLQPEERGLVAV